MTRVLVVEDDPAVRGLLRDFLELLGCAVQLAANGREALRGLGLRDNFFTMSDIDVRGMGACVEDAIAIASRAPGGYAVTFDIDMIDPRFAPGSGTLVRGGAWLI